MALDQPQAPENGSRNTIMLDVLHLLGVGVMTAVAVSLLLVSVGYLVFT
jgi:hypothetical protein